MFQEKVYELCQIMIQKDEIPSEFRKTTLHIIYKGKGKREDLSKNRFIHSKSWFPRLVEGLVVEGALKKPLVEKSSIFQIGGNQIIDLIYLPEEHDWVISKWENIQQNVGPCI